MVFLYIQTYRLTLREINNSDVEIKIDKMNSLKTKK